MQAMALIYVMTGGAIGSAMRYIIMSFIGRLIANPFPFGTLTVNILGSFLMGVWIAVMANLLPERSRDLHLLFAVGVLGGFTTFSTFSLDIYYLFERSAYVEAASYIIGSVLISLLALVAGVWLVRVIA
jgi:fluoride exporter